MPMTDTRKVRPVAPLDAERAEGDGWNVRFPRAGSQRATPSDVYLWWSDAKFAAAFMPAELFDDVLNAARVEILDHTCGNPAYGTPGYCDMCIAVRAYDAHTKGA